MEKNENSQSFQSSSAVLKYASTNGGSKKSSKTPMDIIETVEGDVEQQTNDDFPGWFQFLFILAALILGIFLVGWILRAYLCSADEISGLFRYGKARIPS